MRPLGYPGSRQAGCRSLRTGICPCGPGGPENLPSSLSAGTVRCKRTARPNGRPQLPRSEAQGSAAKIARPVGRAPITGGAEGDRTPDLVIANDALSHLSYGPVPVIDAANGQAGRPRRARLLAKAKQGWKRKVPASRTCPVPCHSLTPVPASGCTTGVETVVSGAWMTGTPTPVSGSRTSVTTSGCSPAIRLEAMPAPCAP